MPSYGREMEGTALTTTAAQVIPVLWVILVFQLGLFSPSEKGYLSMEAGEQHHKMPWLIAAALALTGAVMLCAEWTAINQLPKSSAPSGSAKELMRIGMWIGAFWVFALPTQPWVETTLDRSPVGRLKFRVWRRLGWKGEDPFCRDSPRSQDAEDG